MPQTNLEDRMAKVEGILEQTRPPRLSSRWRAGGRKAKSHRDRTDKLERGARKY